MFFFPIHFCFRTGLFPVLSVRIFSMDPTSSEFKQELRQRLTPLQWSVTQEKGTER